MPTRNLDAGCAPHSAADAGAERENDWLGGPVREVVAAIGIYVSGSLMFPLVTVFIDTLRVERPDLSASEVGVLGSGDTFGMFIGAVLALMTVDRLSRRMLSTVGLVGLVAANLFCALDLSPGALLGLRLVAGAAGGLMMGVGLAAIGATRQPSRNYAFGLVLQMAACGVVVWIFSHGESQASLFTLLSMVTAATALFGLPLPWIRTPRVAIASPDGQAAINPRVPRSFVALTGLVFFVWGVGLLSVWGYLQSIGRSLGLSMGTLGTAMSIGLAGAAIGTLLMGAVGDRFGRSASTVVVASAFLASTAAMLVPLGPVGFGIAVFMFQAASSIGVYPFGALSLVDPTGRLSVVYLLALKAGFGIGPAVGGVLAGAGGYTWVLINGLVVTATAFAGFLLIIRLAERGQGRMLTV